MMTPLRAYSALLPMAHGLASKDCTDEFELEHEGWKKLRVCGSKLWSI